LLHVAGCGIIRNGFAANTRTMDGKIPTWRPRRAGTVLGGSELLRPMTREQNHVQQFLGLIQDLKTPLSLRLKPVAEITDKRPAYDCRFPPRRPIVRKLLTYTIEALIIVMHIEKVSWHQR
jgi:hypothetical protein